MEVIYTKWHNNYPFGIGYRYEAEKYKDGWLLIDGQLYREECFEKVSETVHPNKNRKEEIKMKNVVDQDPFSSGSGPIEVSGDDLPF